MTVMLENAERAHWENLKRHAGIDVFYRRGDDAMEITAVPGRGSNDPLNFEGTPLEDESKSFILGVCDLRNFFPPQSGDVIQVRSTGRRWKIKANSIGAAHTESGNYGVIIRVHAIVR